MRFAATKDRLCSSFQDLAQMRFPHRTGDVAKRAQQPEAHHHITCSVVADLLEHRIQQSVQVDPRQHDTQHMRWVVQMRWRRCTANPANKDTTELIYATDSGAGVIYGG